MDRGQSMSRKQAEIDCILQVMRERVIIGGGYGEIHAKDLAIIYPVTTALRLRRRWNRLLTKGHPSATKTLVRAPVTRPGVCDAEPVTESCDNGNLTLWKAVS